MHTEADTKVICKKTDKDLDIKIIKHTFKLINVF